MNVTAIIAEYNPFQNGHAYQIERAREITCADYIIIIMSGNFMQRGEPAIIDKYARTQMALSNGADLVIELPVCYATGSAEYFAKGAVSILNQLGVVNYLCFGSENDDLTSIMQIAQVLVDEPAQYKKTLKQTLKKGVSFPVARKQALEEYFTNNQSQIDAALLDTPNNILAIEYCKALINSNSDIKPIAIKRVGSEYHNSELSSEYSSASAIRNVITSAYPEQYFNLLLPALKSQLPNDVLMLFNQEYKKSFPVIANDFSAYLQYRLLEIEHNETIGFHKYLDITDDFSDKLHKNIFFFKDYSSFCETLKSKDMTYTRISRNLLHILLSVTKEDCELFLTGSVTYYVRVLGLNKNAQKLTSSIKKNASIPLITSPAKAKQLLDQTGQKQFNSDLLCSHLYNSVVSHKFHCDMQNEYNRQLITQV